MVSVDDSNLQANSEPKSVGSIWGSADAWRWVCIHHTSRMNPVNGGQSRWQRHTLSAVLVLLSTFDNARGQETAATVL